ncbi:hypothetical protein EIP91_010869 [Steccherinum ochraceum]|uniref:Uncharacterized protein n=1 Tax=Steccherinum ochraceum TaxID=92696 RepID=A0A4R0R8M7_9APHY|nr:hypothetical protein EIP91_010869 [Steccherinum ochraceum]
MRYPTLFATILALIASAQFGAAAPIPRDALEARRELDPLVARRIVLHSAYESMDDEFESLLSAASLDTSEEGYQAEVFDNWHNWERRSSSSRKEVTLEGQLDEYGWIDM